MAEKCAFPGCKSYAVNGSYCVGHSKHFSGVSLKPHTEVKKPKKAIPKRSKKEAERMKAVKPMYAAYLSKPENFKCAINSPVCTKKSTCVNHKKGRGANLLKPETWEPSCEPCNGYIEDHHAWAVENGHKVSRHVAT